MSNTTENYINNIDALRAEKARIREKLALSEAGIKENTAYIADHWGWLLLSSFLKPKQGKNSNEWVGEIIDEAIEFGMKAIEKPDNMKESFRDFLKNTVLRVVHSFIKKKN